MKNTVGKHPLSALLTSLPLDFEGAVEQVLVLGFTHVDVVGLADRPAAHLEALADSGLLVSCAAVGRGLPKGCSLDARQIANRRQAVEEVERQIADAARLGATRCYLVPGDDDSADGLTRFSEACRLLADFSASRMVRLCVEHAPGRALASAATTLEWLEQIDHDNLALLLDIGHCLISREDPARVIEQAGRRLGYVHLDDNDGSNDLHWPLLAGRLTEEILTGVLAVLHRVSYDGAIALEFRADSADAVDALRQSKELLERLLPRGGGEKESADGK
jgi:sugar phosphate isomerase/epimerase